jgi:membrane associated rhomboid family serine protease
MELQPITTLIFVVTGVMTFMAFKRRDLWERWMFKPGEVLRHKQYWRMVTSGLIHADWIHFGFNAISFLSFGENIERAYGSVTLLAVYFSSIVGGSLLSLIIHRNHDYSALGASGGVCGVIFASIFLLPGGAINLYFLIGIPTWAYAVLFIVGSYVAHRRGSDNIGHDAHLGGAIVGLLVATAMYPRLIFLSPGLFATVLVLSAAVLYALIGDPLELLGRRMRNHHDEPAGGERERRYAANRRKNEKIAEIDALLDRVSKHGIYSLSAAQRKRLDELSKELRGGSA